MFDQVINHLEIANEYEWNARRLFETAIKSPNWTDTYLQCLGNARRERAVARNLVMIALQDSCADELAPQRGEWERCPDEIRRMTLEQLLQLAATAQSSPAGSRKMRRASERISQVAALLQSNNALAQLLWWCAEVEPIPPGKPVINFDKREAQ